MTKKVSLRVQADLLRILDRVARKNGRSRSNLVLWLLATHPTLQEPLAELRRGEEEISRLSQEAEADNARELEQARQALAGTGRLRVRGSAP